MILDKTNYWQVIDGLERLPGSIDEPSTSAFQAVFGSRVADQATNVVYFFLSEESIPRLLGKSRILYIGQTTQSIKKRHYKHAAEMATTEANLLKYQAAIEEYGSIRIAFGDFKRFGKTPRIAEGRLLWWYFQNHCEYPPINYTKSNVRSPEYRA